MDPEFEGLGIHRMVDVDSIDDSESWRFPMNGSLGYVLAYPLLVAAISGGLIVLLTEALVVGLWERWDRWIRSR